MATLSGDGFYIDYSVTKNLEKYLQVFVKNLDMFEKDMALMNPGLGDAVGNLILKEIPNRLGGSFGQFMADRTDFQVTSTESGFIVSVFGLTESQIPDGKVGAGGQDYNLWAMYEDGGGVGARSARSGPALIKKDAGSVGAIRSGANEFEIQGKAGSVQNVVSGLLPEIEALIQGAMSMYTQGKIKKAAEDAARETNFKQVQNKAISLGFLGLSLSPEVVDIVQTSINGKGIATFQTREAKGRFGKKIGTTFSS